MQASGCGPTRNALHLHVPLCRRVRQFRLDVGALQEQAFPSGREERRREGQKLGQRREGAGGDEGRRWQVCAASMRTACTLNRGAGDARGLAQESGFALIGLDQVEGHAGGKGQDQPGEAGTGAEIDGTIEGRLHQWGNLEQIGDMALPKQRLVAAVQSRLTVRFQRSSSAAKRLQCCQRFT